MARTGAGVSPRNASVPRRTPKSSSRSGAVPYSGSSGANGSAMCDSENIDGGKPEASDVVVSSRAPASTVRATASLLPLGALAMTTVV